MKCPAFLSNLVDTSAKAENAYLDVAVQDILELMICPFLFFGVWVCGFFYPPNVNGV